MTSDQIGMAVANLHDAFLNASVVRDRMLASPLVQESADVSDRFRLERLWVALLAVLVEAWEADQNRDAREFLSTVVDTSRLVGHLREARSAPARDALLQTRHYMFHRDKREYWNVGRLGPCGRLDFHMSLHAEFGKVLLAGISALADQVTPQAEA